MRTKLSVPLNSTSMKELLISRSRYKTAKPCFLWSLLFQNRKIQVYNSRITKRRYSFSIFAFLVIKLYYYYYYYYYYFYSFTRKRFYWVTFKLKDIHRAKFCTATCFICHYTDFGNSECQPRIGLFTPFKFGNADYNIYFLDWKFQTLNGLIGYFLLFTTLHLTIKYFYGGLI